MTFQGFKSTNFDQKLYSKLFCILVSEEKKKDELRCEQIHFALQPFVKNRFKLARQLAKKRIKV